MGNQHDLPVVSAHLPLTRPLWRGDQYIALLVLLLGLLFRVPVPDQSLATQQMAQLIQIELLKPAPVPVLAASQSATITSLLTSVSAEAFVVLDEESAMPLIEKNPTSPLYPASTTKLMTALVARDAYYLSQVLKVPSEAMVEGNTINLTVGQNISASSLLQGLLIKSGNDAAYTLAYNFPGGYDAFVAEMNKRAQKLHLQNTRFANPAGFDDSTHYMSARDLAFLFREVMKDPELKTIMGTIRSQSADVTGTVEQELFNTNELLYLDESVVAGKTGTTPLAGQVLVVQFLRDGHPITVVVMKSQDRYTDTRTLINWVMNEYRWEEVWQNPAE